jgi:hypothetical protein
MKYFLFLALFCNASAQLFCAEQHKIEPIFPEKQVQEFIMFAKQLPAYGDILFANIAHELTTSYPDITRKELISLFIQTNKKNRLRAATLELSMLQQIWHHIEKEKKHILINTIFPTIINLEVLSYNFVSAYWQDKSLKLMSTPINRMQQCLSNSIYIKFHQLHEYFKQLLNGNSFIYLQHLYIGQLSSIADFATNSTTVEKTRTLSYHAHLLLIFYKSDFAHVILADEYNVFVFQHIQYIIGQTDEKKLLETIQATVEQEQEIRFESIPAALDYIRSLDQQQ